MEKTLGQFTFGKLIAYVFPGLIASLAIFLIMDSAIPQPGSLTRWAISDFTGITTLGISLMVFGIIFGLLLDELHHMILIPIYWMTPAYKNLANRERAKLDLIRLIVHKSFADYGMMKVGAKKHPQFKKRLKLLPIDDLEWWFILPASGGVIFTHFNEEYYSRFQFMGNMFFALAGLAIACFVYGTQVVGGLVQQPSPAPLGLAIKVVIVFLPILVFCVWRAGQWYLHCYETQINLIFNVVVDLALQHENLSSDSNEASSIQSALANIEEAQITQHEELKVSTS